MKNNMKKFLALLLAVLMTAALAGTAFADDTSGLSGDGTGNVSSTKSLYYKVTQEKVYTDISGVKLEWSVPVLKYTKTDVRAWNTTTLKWEQEYKDINTGDEVTFTLTNRGSYAVKANVSFSQDSSITTADNVQVSYGSYTDPEDEETIFNANDPIIFSIVNADHSLKVQQGTMSDADYKTARDNYVAANCSATITGKVTVDDISELGTSGKLGTYTVRISDAKFKVTVEWIDSNKKEKTTEYTYRYGDRVSYAENIDAGTVKIGTNDVITTYSEKDTEYEFCGWELAVDKGDYEGEVDISGNAFTVTGDIRITAQYGE